MKACTLLFLFAMASSAVAFPQPLAPSSQQVIGNMPSSSAPPGSPPVFAIASTTADSRLPQDAFLSPQALLRLEEGDAWGRCQLPQQGWQALWGDLDGDTWADYPAGIDALDLLPPPQGAPTTLLDLQFSMDRDAFGFQDGDILGLDPSGKPKVVVSEATLVAALDLQSGGIDLDALCRQEDGSIWFSLKDNATSRSLGPLEDGAILAFSPDSGSVAIIADEATVQTWVTAARGSSAAFGDLKALARHPYSHALLFTIQSPSSEDGSVFTNQGGGFLLQGWQERAWHFQVSSELDALTFPQAWWPQAPVLSTDLTHLAAGLPFQLRVRHASPFSLLRGRASSVQLLRRSSRGGLALSTPALGPEAFVWPGPGELPLTTDGSGSATYDAVAPPLPAGVAAMRFSYQLLDLGEAGISTPLGLRIE